MKIKILIIISILLLGSGCTQTMKQFESIKIPPELINIEKLIQITIKLISDNRQANLEALDELGIKEEFLNCYMALKKGLEAYKHLITGKKGRDSIINQIVEEYQKGE